MYDKSNLNEAISTELRWSTQNFKISDFLLQAFTKTNYGNKCNVGLVNSTYHFKFCLFMQVLNLFHLMYTHSYRIIYDKHFSEVYYNLSCVTCVHKECEQLNTKHLNKNMVKLLLPVSCFAKY
jgi:hypothetical protein